ncbi:MAG: N-acetylmuramoyl-L-alanine amidase family protein [Treponema sp.]
MKKYLLCFVLLLTAVHIGAFTVIIDPGHGGKDPGVHGTGMQDGKKVSVSEKDIALHLAQKTAEVLKSRYPHVQVVLTRTGDSFVSLNERNAKIQAAADGCKALSVSIHNNASPLNNGARGFEIWTKQDIVPFARALSARLAAGIGGAMPNRGIRDVAALPVTPALMPDILLNIGFLSNAEDTALLIREDFCDHISQSLADGIALSFENKTIAVLRNGMDAIKPVPELPLWNRLP